MNAELNDFVDNLISWLENTELYTAEVESSTENTCELRLSTEDDNNVCVGNCIEPGITLKWLGEHKIGEKTVQLVEVNSVVIQALGKHVAAWVCGYDTSFA